MSKTPKMFYEIHAAVDFLEVFQASGLRSRESAVWTSAMGRVRKLKYVTDAWIDHTCIIQIRTESQSTAVAERRIKDVIAKATRILQSYKAVKERA